MRDTVRLILSSTVPSQEKNSGYSAVSLNGELSFDYAPLHYPACNYEMEFLELYYNPKRVSLEKCTRRQCPDFVESAPLHSTVMI